MPTTHTEPGKRALSATSLVSGEFLRHHDRLLRPALDVWADELHRELDELKPGTAAEPAQLDAVSSCMNKASFVIASTGNLDQALRLCRLQLEWVDRRARDIGEAWVLSHAVQPWVNIGRLHALRGDRRRALEHFRLAVALSRGRTAELGPCRMTAEAWSAVVEAAPELPDILWNVYTLETIKGCMRADRDEDALGLIASLRRAVPAHSHGFIAEGEILVLLRQGNAKEAVARADRADPASAYDEAAFRLHKTTGLIILGQQEPAFRIAFGTLAFLTNVEPRRPKDAPTLLRQLKHIGVLMTALNEPRYALAANLRGLDICATHDDQPLRHTFLRSALRLAPTHPSAGRWQRELRDLSRNGLYREVRGRGAEAVPVDGVPFSGLCRAIETAATPVGGVSESRRERKE
ncbi:hypothetical protein ABZ442_27595 [Streptomyces triculaminicus]|uniref:hypothetical protein n=1 Tax=Streptomyces triculaminicus TaxID=2816232 RepID=UPI0033E193FC